MVWVWVIDQVSHAQLVPLHSGWIFVPGCGLVEDMEPTSIERKTSKSSLHSSTLGEHASG